MSIKNIDDDLGKKLDNVEAKLIQKIDNVSKDLEKMDIRTGKSFEDVQNQISNLTHKVSNLEGAVSVLQEDVTEIKHNMLTMEDNILGAINKLQVENSITASYRPRIENHEQRITKLEKLQFAN